MAGTPTQYYGFPTYADSDAVDLTAQYNSAMVSIDSELHQLDLKTNRERTIVLIGDSWLDTFGEDTVTALTLAYPGYTIDNRAVSSSDFADIAEQFTAAVTAHGVADIYRVICVGGVNSYGWGGKTSTDVGNEMKAFNDAVEASALPNSKVRVILNCANSDLMVSQLMSREMRNTITNRMIGAGISYDISTAFALLFAQTAHGGIFLTEDTGGAQHLSATGNKMLTKSVMAAIEGADIRWGGSGGGQNSMSAFITRDSTLLNKWGGTTLSNAPASLAAFMYWANLGTVTGGSGNYTIECSAGTTFIMNIS